MVVDVLKKFKKEAVARRERGEARPAGGNGGGAPVEAAPKHEPAHRFFVSSNWKNLLEKKPTIAPKTAAAQPSASAVGPNSVDVVALDCEMVGVGPGGTRSALARVSIVDHQGTVMLDKYVRPREEITDYRTKVTGITSTTLKAKGVWDMRFAMAKAAALLKGRIVVGHAVHHDFRVLELDHPHVLIRDTSSFRPLRVPGRERKLPSLALLCSHWLHEQIHEAAHDSVEDARVALRLYNLKSRLWEKQMRNAMRQHLSGEARGAGEGGDDEIDEEGEQVQREAFELQTMGSKRRNRRRNTVGTAAEVAAAMLAEHERKAKRRKEEEVAATSSNTRTESEQRVVAAASGGEATPSTAISSNSGKKPRTSMANAAGAAGAGSAKPTAGSVPANPGKKQRRALARRAAAAAGPAAGPAAGRTSTAKAAARKHK